MLDKTFGAFLCAFGNLILGCLTIVLSGQTWIDNLRTKNHFC